MLGFSVLILRSPTFSPSWRQEFEITPQTDTLQPLILALSHPIHCFINQPTQAPHMVVSSAGYWCCVVIHDMTSEHLFDQSNLVAF